MMKHRLSRLIIFTVLLAALAGGPQEVNAEPESSVTIGTILVPPIIFEETGDYIKLNDTLFAVEFYKDAQGFNKIYNATGHVLVYDERHYLEYWKETGGSWNVRGIPYSLTWVKVHDWHYNVTRHYTDYIGTDWNITFIVRSGEPIKRVVVVDSGQTDSYRISWQLSGVTFTDNISEVNGVDFGSGQLGIYWDDVYESFGNITAYTVESHAQGRKLSVNFEVGKITAGSSLVLDPTITTSTSHWGLSFPRQRKIFWDGTYWWFTYYTGTGWNYTYTDDLTSISNAQTLFKTTTNYGRAGLDVAYNGSGGVALTYGGVVNYRIFVRFGEISGTSISWGSEYTRYATGTYYQGLDGDYTPDGDYRLIYHKATDNDVHYEYTANDGGSWSGGDVDASETISSTVGGVIQLGLSSNDWMNILQDGGNNLRWSINIGDFADLGEDVVDVSRSAFGAVTQGNVVHLAWLDPSSILKYKRYNGTAWEATETILDSTSDTACYPAITLDDEGGKVYVLWGDAVDDVIYYRKRDSDTSSGTWDSSSTVLVDESEEELYGGTTYGNGRLSVPDYFNNSEIPVMYVTNLTSPYYTKVAKLAANAEPTITSASCPDLKTTDNMYGMDGYYSFEVVANDGDGAIDIDKVYLQAKSGETVRWEVRATDLTGTPAFAIQTGATIIDLTTSSWSEDGNAGTATFEVRAEFDHPGYADLELAVYVEDSSAASAGWTDMQTDYFDIINRLVVENFVASDTRHNVGGTVTFSGNIYYATTVSGNTASSYYPADALFTGIDIHDASHANKGNDLTIVNGAFTSSAVTLSSSVTSTDYHVYINLAGDGTDGDAPDGDTVAVISDRLEIVSVAFDDNRIDVSGSAEVRYVLRYDYDDVAFTGSDGSISGFTWDAVNSWWDKAITGSASVTTTNYDESDIGAITDSNYGLTAKEDDTGANIITDRVKCIRTNTKVAPSGAYGDNRVNVNQDMYIKFELRYEYDNAYLDSESTVTIEGNSATRILDMGWDTNYCWQFTDTGSASVTSRLYDEFTVSDAQYGLTAVNQNGQSETIIWDRIQAISTSVNDSSRINVYDTIEVEWTLVYDYDDTAVTDGSVWIEGIAAIHQGSGVWQILRGYSIVTSATWDEFTAQANTHGITVEDANGQTDTVIWDRMWVYYEVVDDSIKLKNENIEYRIKFKSEYDGHEGDASDTVTANSGAMAWDEGNGWYDDQKTLAAVGNYLFDVTAITEATYGITAFNDNLTSPTGYWKDTPGNDAADSDATFDVDVYGWVNITVTDEDGVANLATVDIQVTTSGSEVFTLRWTQSSGVFSEQSDASGVCTLSGSTRVNLDADTDKIGFRFKLSAGAQMGAVSVQATSTDDDGYSDQDTYSSEFSINWYGEITIDDGSHSWSNLSPGDADQILPGDGDIDVTVSSNGVFDLQCKGGGDLTSGGYSIALGNVKVHASTLGSAASVTTGYVDIGGMTGRTRGLSLAKSFKLWLTVPNPQQDGSYTYTLSVQVTTP